MTDRGRAVAALGLVVYLAAWIFGSHALYPVAVGLLLAVVVAIAWVRLSARPPHVRRHGASRDVVADRSMGGAQHEGGAVSGVGAGQLLTAAIGARSGQR